MKVLILCTGNSCRSQMAHGWLQSFDESLEVYSAGTAPAPQVNPNAVKAMAEAGIDISTHTPKSVDLYLDQEWDYVITVCGGANESCPAFVGNVKIVFISVSTILRRLLANPILCGESTSECATRLRRGSTTSTPRSLKDFVLYLNAAARVSSRVYKR